MATTPSAIQGLFNSRRGRRVLENLTAYLFILPAGLIIFVFGIFPVAFAFFVSLHDWRRFAEGYEGLTNYYKAIGSLAYVLFFWIALGLMFYAGLVVYRQWKHSVDDLNARWMIMPGAVLAVAGALFTDWFFKALLEVLNVPQRIPTGVARNRDLFIEEFFNSFQTTHVSQAGNNMLLGIIAATIVSFVFVRLIKTKLTSTYIFRFMMAGLATIAGIVLLQTTLDEIDVAIEAAKATGEDLPIWSYIIFMSFGALLLGLAYMLWTYAVHQVSDRRFSLMAIAALMLMVGGYVTMTQIPQAVTFADDDLMQGFWVTVMYVIGTVPIQLSIGLGLAYLLFYLANGKTFFRMMYFLPYITPFAATAVVFSTLFSSRNESPINRIINILGINSQKWLVEPTPIMELISGKDLPQIIEGPGLALLVIVLWSTWTYIGFDIVIFMAGLGNISTDYYEAAQIDGANRWNIFRHITLPLLSPTTFFLSLVAVIGTFQAFTQIWMMRRQGAYDAVDTVGVYMYETITSARPQNGYGAAMAFVLFGVIMIITLFQNKILGRRVFYG